MKHIIILGDGMADWPVESLGNMTLLQYAKTPYMDLLAKKGKTGMLKTVQDGFHPGSEVANSSILGYDQEQVYEGRGPLEAASIGVELAPDDMAIRCNIICIEGDLIKNHSCGRLETEEGDILIKYLQDKLANDPEIVAKYGNIVHFYTGVQYRHLLVINGGNKYIKCTPPHDVPLHPWRPELVKPDTEAEAKALANGAKPTKLSATETAELINTLIVKSQELLGKHPFNAQRIAEGKDPANSISGLRCIDVEGATGLYDTNYEGKAAAAIEALKTDDFVYLHVEASDEAGHDGDLELKLQTIENLDKRAIGPIYEEVKNWDEPVAIAVLPDHPTPVAHRTHTNEPIPFLIYAPGIEPDGVQTFDEVACKEGSYGTLEKDGFIKAFMAIN